jgi:hypothetical protein
LNERLRDKVAAPGDAFELDGEWFRAESDEPGRQVGNSCEGCVANTEEGVGLCEKMPDCGARSVIFREWARLDTYQVPHVGTKWTAPDGTEVEFSGFQHAATGEQYLFTEPTLGILRVTSREGFAPKRGT